MARVGVFLGMFLFMVTCTVAHAELPEFTTLAEKAGSAVVNISTVRTVEGGQMQQFFGGPFGNRGGPGGPFGDRGAPFEDFFEQFERFFGERQMPPRQQRSLGSGFIISQDGLIVTNNHVVAEADEVNVTLEGGTSFTAEVVGKDPETDIALLKIDPDRKLTTLELGNSNDMKIGQWVVAIGNPFGLQNTVTAGIISAKGRIIGAGPYDNFIQTDASINPGNSGGPLLNMEGEVIGINTAIVATGQGIGFAYPSTEARYVINQLQKFGEVQRGWLGVTIQDVDENTAKALGLKEPRGALIASVQPDNPASKAGLTSGDVIVSVNGEEIEDAHELTRVIGRFSPGEKVSMRVWRKGKERKVTVDLGKRPPQQELAQRTQPGEPAPEQGSAALGMALRPLSEQEAQALDMEQGTGLLVADVQPGSPAGQNNIRPGDVILEANGEQIRSMSDFQDVLENDARQKGVLMLLVQRGGQSLFRTIPLEGEQQ
ncbi:MAG: DegQ family serine endoprotease [Desulfovibrionales bacterium]